MSVNVCFVVENHCSRPATFNCIYNLIHVMACMHLQLILPVCMYHKYKPPDCPITLNGFQGAVASDNAEIWKWKLTALLQNNDIQEVLSREKKDRRDYEQIAALASKMGLYRYL